MIKYWSLSHFKSVLDKTKLDLAPLTIFAGANSSGKSTVIQNILLTTQTVQNPVLNRPVVLNGHIARLGAFTDIVSNADEKSEINIGFGIEFPGEEEKRSRSSYINRVPRYYYHNLDMRRGFSVHCNYSFSINSNETDKELLKLQPLLEKSSVTVNVPKKDGNIEHSVLIERLKKSKKERIEDLNLEEDELIDPELDSLDYVVQEINPSSYGRPAAKQLQKKKIAGSTLRHFLPSRVSVVYDSVETEVRQIIDFLTSSRGTRDLYTINESNVLNEKVRSIIIDIYKSVQELENEKIDSRLERMISNLGDDFDIQDLVKVFRVIPPSLKDEIADHVKDRRNELREAIINGREPNYTLRFLPTPELVSAGVRASYDFFSSFVKYLGPLRDEPKPVYPLAGATDPTDIGFKGEYTAAVLDIHRNTEIEYIPSEFYSSNSNSYKSTKAKLSIAVQDWLNYMGVGSEIKTEDMGKLGHQLKISSLDSETFHDLTQVGVGVSQVLPILVLSLISDTGTTIIFEQPELHLHPKVQTRLADFFVSMTQLDKQCIVETHSEYLINRLRYRSAISEGKSISDSVIIYFVEKEEGQSSYRKIELNEYGVIEDWPKGFFDENEELAAKILKAGIKKRKKSSEESDD